jgi:hypothetical protein
VSRLGNESRRQLQSAVLMGGMALPETPAGVWGASATASSKLRRIDLLRNNA